MFNSLHLNRDFFKGKNFYYIQDVLDNKFDLISKNEKFLKRANIIIVSYRWNDYKFNRFKDNLDQIKDLNQKIFITSSANEYEVISKFYTLLDYEVLFRNKDLNYFGFKKLYFKNRIINSTSIINQKLKNFALENNLTYLSKEDYMCDIVEEECDYVNEDGYKIFFDYGHYTEYGARYFGKKIYEINWLKIN